MAHRSVPSGGAAGGVGLVVVSSTPSYTGPRRSGPRGHGTMSEHVVKLSEVPVVMSSPPGCGPVACRAVLQPLWTFLMQSEPRSPEWALLARRARRRQHRPLDKTSGCARRPCVPSVTGVLRTRRATTVCCPLAKGIIWMLFRTRQNRTSEVW